MTIHKEEEKLVAYREINVSQCFEYSDRVYLKCQDTIPSGKKYDVDLRRGIVSPPLNDDDLVKPLYDASLYTYKIEEE